MSPVVANHEENENKMRTTSYVFLNHDDIFMPKNIKPIRENDDTNNIIFNRKSTYDLD